MEYRPDNGVLSYVPGEESAAASLTLPPCGPESPKKATVEINSERCGHILLTFEPFMHKRGRNRHWFWLAVHAEPLGER